MANGDYNDGSRHPNDHGIIGQPLSTIVEMKNAKERLEKMVLKILSNEALVTKLIDNTIQLWDDSGKRIDKASEKIVRFAHNLNNEIDKRIESVYGK